MTQDHDATERRAAAQIDTGLFVVAKFLADRSSDDEESYTWHEFYGDARDLAHVLSDRGYTIAPTEPGRVVIEWNTIEVALLDMDYAHMTAYEITHRIMQALDAAAERAATGGE